MLPSSSRKCKRTAISLQFLENITVDEEDENSDIEYAKMELPQTMTLCQRMMNCKVAERIEWVHWA